MKSLTQFFFFTSTFFALILSLYSADNQLSQKEVSQGWQLLFDGKNLSKSWKTFGQESLTPQWLVKEGMFGIQEDAGDLITKASYSDFEFKIDWKVAKEGNSGILLRVDDSGKRAHSYALEVQILDDENFRSAKGDPPTEKQKSGSIYDIQAAKPGVFKGHDTWNTTHVIAKGKKVTVYMNNILVAEIDQASEQYKELYKQSKFSKQKKIDPKFGKAMSGPIALQDHHSEIWFKNAKVKEL